ncbi:MAG: hypothetical protein B7Z16_06965 [Algoriphagus sp. 32-45-6]|nr:MAG: hypothetical protein B7Z16_06965 [Algoriphagus sp. 32-45-6]
MKWTYQIRGKAKISLLLTGLICLILVNNLSERSQSRELQKVLDSMYQDRLIAESYILQLSDELHSIGLILESGSDFQESLLYSHWQKIEQINLNYLETQLTKEEKNHFDRFEKMTWAIFQGIPERKNSQATLQEALTELKILSEIQVKEAQNLISRSGQIFSSDAAHSQLEIALLVVMVLIVQAILFASKTLSVVPKAPPQLN